MTVQEGQYTEEEWFSNSDMSKELERFLNIIASPVKLKDYKGYAAGLDTKSKNITYVFMCHILYDI